MRCKPFDVQSLLELALRTSVAASDPYHEDLTCNIVSTVLSLLLKVLWASVVAHTVKPDYLCWEFTAVRIQS